MIADEVNFGGFEFFSGEEGDGAPWKCVHESSDAGVGKEFYGWAFDGPGNFGAKEHAEDIVTRSNPFAFSKGAIWKGGEFDVSEGNGNGALELDIGWGRPADVNGHGSAVREDDVGVESFRSEGFGQVVFPFARRTWVVGKHCAEFNEHGYQRAKRGKIAVEGEEHFV